MSSVLGARRAVAIARATSRWDGDSSVLVLDEPTAFLSGDDVETLFDIVRRIAAAGQAVMIVTHHLDEVLSLADIVTVLRDGRVMGWGENEFGAVGNGTYELEVYPVAVCAVGVSECPDGPYLEEAAAVAAGGLQSLALLRDGSVLAWGGNLYGDIGGESERTGRGARGCLCEGARCGRQALGQ